MTGIERLRDIVQHLPFKGRSTDVDCIVEEKNLLS